MMVKVFIVVILFLMSCNSSLYDDKKKDTHRRNKIVEYTEKINQNPNDAQNYFDRGITYELLEQPDKALEDYNKAIELDKDFESPYVWRSHILLDKKNYSEALQSIDQIIRIMRIQGKEIPIGYFKIRGESYYGLHRYEEAIKDYSKVIDDEYIDDAFIESLEQRFFLYGVVNEYEKSLADMKRLFKFVEPNYEHYEMAGRNYHFLKEYDKAIENFNKALSMNKNSIFSYLELSAIYIELNNATKAEDYFIKALKHGCDRMDVIYSDEYVKFFGKEKIDKFVKKYVKKG